MIIRYLEEQGQYKLLKQLKFYKKKHKKDRLHQFGEEGLIDVATASTLERLSMHSHAGAWERDKFILGEEFKIYFRRGVQNLFCSTDGVGRITNSVGLTLAVVCKAFYV